MKLLFESWRQFLTEVEFAAVEGNLDGERLYKFFKAARWDYLNNKQLRKDYGPQARVRKNGPNPRRLTDAAAATFYREVKEGILEFIPKDIEERYRGVALSWFIKRVLVSPPGNPEEHLRIGIFDGIWGAGLDPHDNERRLGIDRMQDIIGGLLETFFQHNRFMSERDINNIKTLEELRDVVEAARDDIQAYLEKQSYLDAEQGKQLIYEDDEWQIIIPTNKGAACELGKGTDWCTAAPGLDYYEEYHKPNDPLFIFMNKQKPEERYQFHFGSEQFMNRDDVSIEDNEELFYSLLVLLKKAENVPAPIKEKIKNVDYQKLDNGGMLIHDFDGAKEWYLNGERHRTDGPAVVDANGDKYWYLNGKLHRTDGPAIVYPDGTKYWYLNGKQFSEAEWEQKVQKMKGTELTEQRLIRIIKEELRNYETPI